MKKLLIKNGKVIDPANDLAEVCDILIEHGKIKKIDKKIIDVDAEIVDAEGFLVCPGFIDMHVHFREPGREDKETIYTGSCAAAAGGFTSVACMANTEPVIDNQMGIEYIISKAEKEAIVNVFPVGGVTKGLKGENLSEIGAIAEAGAVAISDDGNCILNSMVMRRALEYIKMFDLPIISHCEDTNLTQDCHMNEGFYSTNLGFKGMPTAAEDTIVSRNIILTEFCNSKMHITHISSKRSVEMVREAKKRILDGLSDCQITADVTPHHFSLTDEDVKLMNYDTNTKMKPPLRSKNDLEECLVGLQDGTIDCIASDHAPHTDVEKDVEFMFAPFGIIGLETTIPLTFMNLVEKGVFSINEAVNKLSVNPAQILNLKNKGSLKVGADADVTIINPDLEIEITPSFFHSKSKNSPFIDRKLKGFAVMTIVDGEIVFRR